MVKNKMMKNVVEDFTEDLDQPFKISDSWSFLKKGKIRVVIYYEDKSFKEYFVKLKDDYVITIRKKMYILVPECFTFGKYNTIQYYYNNPMPLNYSYKHSKLRSGDVRNISKSKISTFDIDVVIDAKILYTAFTSQLINKMYDENRGLTAKNFIVIAVVAIVLILIVLQVTGVVDVASFFARG